MYKVCAIGDFDSMLGFNAMGLDVFPCTTVEEARRTLHKAARGKFAIVIITENFARDMQEDMNRYKDERLPAIVPIPGMDGNYGVGMGNLKKSIQRAVGADLIFGGEHK